MGVQDFSALELGPVYELIADCIRRFEKAVEERPLSAEPPGSATNIYRALSTALGSYLLAIQSQSRANGEFGLTAAR